MLLDSEGAQHFLHYRQEKMEVFRSSRVKDSIECVALYGRDFYYSIFIRLSSKQVSFLYFVSKV